MSSLYLAGIVNRKCKKLPINRELLYLRTRELSTPRYGAAPVYAFLTAIGHFSRMFLSFL
jgi:hypothetical protein